MAFLERVQGKLFYLVVMLFWFAQYIYGPFLSPYLAAAGVSAALIGTIAGAYGFTQMLLRVPLSLGDSLTGNHRLFMGGGLLAIVLACLLPFLSDSPQIFLLSRAAAGVASATWVSYAAFALEGEGNANQRMGRLITANSAGVFLSMLTGTLLYKGSNIRLLFGIGALAAAIGFGLFLLGSSGGTRPAAVQKSFSGAGFVQTLRSKNLWLCSLLMALAQFILFATNGSFVGVFAQESLKASGSQIGLLSLVSQALGVATSFILGKTATRRLPERELLTGCFLLLALYCVCIAFVGSASLLIALQALAGISMTATNVLLMANAGRELDGGQKALAMGVFQSVYGLGMTFGPVAAGAVHGLVGSYPSTFLLVGAVGILAAIWAFFAYKNPRVQAF
ncbi:MAG: MFS transporter [Christensenellaceae bacterium]|jgi:predicted MFS family arabinose efflux permease|nr:MFS transporter [Christensenellaceae bacterium]